MHPTSLVTANDSMESRAASSIKASGSCHSADVMTQTHLNAGQSPRSIVHSTVVQVSGTASIDNVPFAVDETGSFSWQEVQESTLHTVRHASVPSIVIVASVCVDSILGAISTLRKLPIPVI